ncbi:MAG: hypothetical protein EBR82_24275 [Caulobacteraceae bacterium]|nr:hypothetical protein [Caulobacteraceae bacterium]
MAICFEDNNSPSSIILEGNSQAVQRQYTVLEAASDTEAYDAVAGVAPASYQGVGRAYIRQPWTMSHEGAGVYRAKVQYLPPEVSGNDASSENATAKLLFDTTGATTKKYATDADNQRYYRWENGGSPLPPPDLRGALGWDGEKANGIDVPVPALKLTLEVTYNQQFISASTIKDWARSVGKTNSDSFLRFAPGELLFLGATGDAVIDLGYLNSVQPVTVQYHMLASENITSPYKEGDITIPRKGGHQYVDPVFVDWIEASKQKSSRLAFVFVSTVFKEVSFFALTGVRT